MTAVVVGLVARFVAGQASPAALVIGNGLALSSTAVVLQVTFNEKLLLEIDFPLVLFGGLMLSTKVALNYSFTHTQKKEFPELQLTALKD